MPRRQDSETKRNWKAALLEDADFLKGLIREALQKILDTTPALLWRTSLPGDEVSVGQRNHPAGRLPTSGLRG